MKVCSRTSAASWCLCPRTCSHGRRGFGLGLVGQWSPRQHLAQLLPLWICDVVEDHVRHVFMNELQIIDRISSPKYTSISTMVAARNCRDGSRSLVSTPIAYCGSHAWPHKLVLLPSSPATMGSNTSLGSSVLPKSHISSSNPRTVKSSDPTESRLLKS